MCHLTSTSFVGHPAAIPNWSKDIKVSLHYAVSRRLVGSHCTPRGIIPPLGTNDRGVIQPGKSLISVTWAQICVGDMRVSHLQATYRQHHLSENIGPAIAGSARPAPPALHIINSYVLYASHRNAKSLGVLQHPQAPWSSVSHLLTTVKRLVILYIQAFLFVLCCFSILSLLFLDRHLSFDQKCSLIVQVKILVW